MHVERVTWKPTAALLGALSVAWAGCEPPLSVTGFSGATMGTTYRVLLETSVSATDTVALGAVIEGELARINRVMSTYDASSDVSRFGGVVGTEPVPVDAMLLEVLEAALEVCAGSGGAFDPTVAPLVDAWGFGPLDAPPPDSTLVSVLMERVGCAGLVVDRDAGTVAKKNPLARIDLSGIAKGFAAERIGQELLALGYTSVLVDVGGELRAVGTHRNGRPWRAALEGPGETVPGPMSAIDLQDEAVATSGDFRNYYEFMGRVYAHIIDPRTGYPVPYRGFSVSVVHPDATRADAWATALAVLGPEAGFDLAEREGLAALFTWRSPEGVQSRVTSRLEGRLLVL
jgi:thiamine biosynthesis lipoprotein